ncbi:beta-lactamase/transpeptidase-like protein [Hyaloraphidium curvatum]|nr:beta-lactamase/transpeptidase-like protein [Hyaloraphidium curvatum]
MAPAGLPVTVVTCAPGYEGVRDAFLSNWDEKDGETGAGLCIYKDGKCVVEMYAGHSDFDKTKPYTPESLNIVHSSGKALMSLTIAHLVGKGLLKYEDPVAKYWPEFAAGGKENVTIADLCAHSGGVGWLDDEHLPTIEDVQMGNQEKLAAKIASQPHNFGGKTTKSYHAVTRGWFLNELVRRVAGKTHGDLWRDELNAKLGAEVYCGLPKDKHGRVSLLQEEDMLVAQYQVMMADQTTPIYKTFASIPKGVQKQLVDSSVGSNDPQLWTSETSAAFTVTNARTLGRLAGAMAQGGSIDGVELVSPKGFEAASKIHEGVKNDPDACIGFPVPYTHGGWAESMAGIRIPVYLFDLTAQPPKPLYTESMVGNDVTWHGWFGYGGSVFQWSKEHGLGFGYVPNRLRAGLLGDGRSAKIFDALLKAAVKN